MIKNANQNKGFEELDVDFDFDTMEGYLSSQLESSFSDLKLIEEDRKKIANPNELGKTVLDEVWKQFGNQIGLDITNETLIQKYNREHPETYSELKDDIMKDSRYKAASKEMKKQQETGTLKDEYTGKTLKQNDNANLDHVVSRKELYENQRRRQANLDTKDLANLDENLKPTNENLNKSKGAKSVDDYSANREHQENNLKAQNERANKKIDKSDLSAAEKRLQREKNDKALQNKLDADDELMKKADQEARKVINKEIRKNATKEIGKKAGKDALKTMAISLLFGLLKEVMNAFVRFLKEESKSLESFLSQMKEAVKSFLSKITSVLQTGASAFLGTIVSEIFGPIVSIFNKLASFIKQGVSSFIDAIKYLRDKDNENKPFSVKVAQVGKIITVGLTAGNAIILSEVFEKFLLAVPGMQTILPLIGSLANVIGLFLGSLVSGLVGAVVLNLIDKYIAKKLNTESTKEILNKQNDVIDIQKLQTAVGIKQVEKSKQTAYDEIKERHKFLKYQTPEALAKIFNDEYTDKILTQNDRKNLDHAVFQKEVFVTENSNALRQMQNDLKNLL